MKSTYLTIALLFCLASCKDTPAEVSKKENHAAITEEEVQQKAVEEVKRKVKEGFPDQPNSKDTIQCDSVYPGKGFKIYLKRLALTDQKESDSNTVFIVYQLQEGRYTEIFRDSIFRQFESIQFKDFNGDNIKDILIENVSDVRSNLTYYLYLVDLKQNQFKKINGFEDIKNPRYLPEHDLIDNMVMSGRDWTSFYKIKGSTIKNYEDRYVVYWGQDEDGNPKDPDKEYQRILRKVLRD